MAALFVLFMAATTGAFLVLQVVFPLILNRPILSWFRSASRLDKIKTQFRVAEQAAETADAEQTLHEFLDNQIDKVNKQ